MEVIDRTLLPCSLRTKADQIVSASVYFVFACLSFTCSALVQHIFFLAYSLMPYTNPNTVNRPLIKWDPGVPGSPPPSTAQRMIFIRMCFEHANLFT